MALVPKSISDAPLTRILLSDFVEFGIVWHLGKAGEPLLDKLWFYVASLRIKSDSSVMLERDYKSMTQ